MGAKGLPALIQKEHSCGPSEERKPTLIQESRILTPPAAPTLRIEQPCSVRGRSWIA